MPSHPERVRLNYQCHICDGTGRDDDLYEGSSPCSECDGSGILLHGPKPKPSGRGLFASSDWVHSELLHSLTQSCHIAGLVNRPYDDDHDA